MFGTRLPPLPIQAEVIWKRRQHQVKKADRRQIVHAVGKKIGALYGGEMKTPRSNCRRPAKQSQKQKATSCNEAVPDDGKNTFFAQAEMPAKRHDPTQPRYQRAFQRKNCFGEIPTD